MIFLILHLVIFVKKSHNGDDFTGDNIVCSPLVTTLIFLNVKERLVLNNYSFICNKHEIFAPHCYIASIREEF